MTCGNRAAAIALILMTLWTAPLFLNNAHGQESNNPPQFNTPESVELNYLFPRGTSARVNFDPMEGAVTDAEGDDITYSYQAQMPGIKDEATLEDTLLQVGDDAAGFHISAREDITPKQYQTTYGDRKNYDVRIIIRATDTAGGFDELTVTVTINHDGSPQFVGDSSFDSNQTWKVDHTVKVFEGPSANLMLHQEDLWKQDEMGDDLPGKPPGISGVTNALQIPSQATNDSQKTWSILDDSDTHSYRCRLANGNSVDQEWTGTSDAGTFELVNPDGQLEGHIGLRFKEDPTEGLLSHTEYTIRIAAKHDFHGTEQDTNNDTILSSPGCDGAVIEVTIRVTDMRPPSPPANFTATIVNDAINLSWDPPDNTYIDPDTMDRTAYLDSNFHANMVRLDHSGGTTLMLDSQTLESGHKLPATTTSLTGITGTERTLYHFMLYFEHANNGEQGSSDPTRVEIGLPGPPDAPGTPKVRTVSNTALQATWEEPHDGYSSITGYVVEYKKEAEADTEWKEVTRTGVERKQDLTGLDNDTAYEVRVKTVNAKGTSGVSDSGEGTTSSQVAQITAGPDTREGRTATFTVTTTEAGTITVNLEWEFGYDPGNATSGTTRETPPRVRST